MNEYQKSKKISAGPVFLRNELEETVLRVTPEGKFFVRYPGETEYEVEHSTKMATDAWIAWIEITKEEYESY